MSLILAGVAAFTLGGTGDAIRADGSIHGPVAIGVGLNQFAGGRQPTPPPPVIA
jgi:hypothetical protein